MRSSSATVSFRHGAQMSHYTRQRHQIFRLRIYRKKTYMSLGLWAFQLFPLTPSISTQYVDVRNIRADETSRTLNQAAQILTKAVWAWSKSLDTNAWLQSMRRTFQDQEVMVRTHLGTEWYYKHKLLLFLIKREQRILSCSLTLTAVELSTLHFSCATFSRVRGEDFGIRGLWGRSTPNIRTLSREDDSRRLSIVFSVRLTSPLRRM